MALQHRGCFISGRAVTLLCLYSDPWASGQAANGGVFLCTGRATLKLLMVREAAPLFIPLNVSWSSARPPPPIAPLLLDFFGSASCGLPGSCWFRMGLEHRLIGTALHPARLRLLLARIDNKPENILKVFARRLKRCCLSAGTLRSERTQLRASALATRGKARSGAVPAPKRR